MLSSAVGADAFHHVVDAFERETVGQMHERYWQSAQTKRAMALCAIEMHMQILYLTRAGVAANCIFQRAAVCIIVRKIRRRIAVGLMPRAESLSSSSCSSVIQISQDSISRCLKSFLWRLWRLLSS